MTRNYSKKDIKATTRTHNVRGVEIQEFTILMPLELIYSDDETQDKYRDLKDPILNLSCKINILGQMIKLIEQREDGFSGEK